MRTRSSKTPTIPVIPSDAPLASANAFLLFPKQILELYLHCKTRAQDPPDTTECPNLELVPILMSFVNEITTIFHNKDLRLQSILTYFSKSLKHFMPAR